MFLQKKNFNIKSLNSFHLNISVKEYIRTDSIPDLKEWLSETKPDINKILILGGGSNLLFTSDYNGTVIHPAFDFIKTVSEDDDNILIEAGSGKNWDEFVEFCVANSYFGVENLSLIPGTTGAAPVQNIGAYGVEAKDVIEKVNGIYLESGNSFSLSNDECRFGYRNSIFKNELKNKVLITSVVFRLSKNETFNLRYGHLEEKVKGLGEININNVRKAVISIRRSKLPDPDITGNAGSFFKNPEVPNGLYNELKNIYPDMPGYQSGNGKIKIPAGWLIDKAGWKGRSMGNAAVHSEQALVLINTGNATGKDIMALASAIEEDIRDKFGIELEKEVIVIGEN